MANRRKKLCQRIERDRARRAQRSAGSGHLAESQFAHARGEGKGQQEEIDDPNSSSDSSDVESLASFQSEALASMDFDELQSRLAANEAKERKTGNPPRIEEAEAAHVRRTEYASLAQSKMGKQQQLDELSNRVVKEQAGAATVREQLEAALIDEQAHLQNWQATDTELREAELNRSTHVSQKAKAKELALEKAQLAEASLGELKERYREVRYREERTMRAVNEAERSGKDRARALNMQAEALRRERAVWTRRIITSEADRRALFCEAQHVEQGLRLENVRRIEVRGEATRYRELLRNEL